MEARGSKRHTGLAAMDSGYKGEASLQHVRKVLEDLRLEDEYKVEFAELADELDRNTASPTESAVCGK